MATSRGQLRTAILIVILHISTSSSAKNSARPVYETINEQARMDDKRTQTTPFLPYSNPLAGNSQHNAKLHAQNQQAMFNAERIRQHRAQLQRLNKATQQTDSYMRAYHESQENHQLALEQQQAKILDQRDFIPSLTSVTKSSTPATRAPPRQRQAKRSRRPDLTKIMLEESSLADKSRNHRSYGSGGYKNLHQKMYKAVYVTPGTTYDQGVTIKPNGNVGLAQLDHDVPSPLYTQAVPSQTQYVYPRQYNQMQNYESAQDIAALNALLKKEPQEQLLELNALVQPEKPTQNELETPLDLYFYLKDPKLAQHYAQLMYAQKLHNYASDYMPHLKDHTPITEEVDDIEDPNQVKRPFTPQPVISTTPKEITTNNINYFSVQPTVATSAGYYKQTEEHPTYAALAFEKPVNIFNQAHHDTSERYSPSKGKPTGVQHLNEDGTGVSAYGDDNLQYAANYEFGYHVRDHVSGNDFGHMEARKNGNTDGHYHVLLPDGRMQNVNYRAGPDGFHADISYE